jgi:hypothetical protein
MPGDFFRGHWLGIEVFFDWWIGSLNSIGNSQWTSFTLSATELTVALTRLVTLSAMLGFSGVTGGTSLSSSMASSRIDQEGQPIRGWDDCAKGLWNSRSGAFLSVLEGVLAPRIVEAYPFGSCEGLLVMRL